MSRCDAVVVAVDDSEAVVEVAGRAPACGSCKSADGCQTGLMGLSDGPRRYRVANGIGARPGDRVSLSVAEGTVFRASLVSYLWPALLAIAGAAAGQWLAGDGGALAGTLFGLILGFVLLRQSELRLRQRGSPLSMQASLPEIHLFKDTP